MSERINPKWRRGIKESVNETEIKDGNILVTTDTGELFVDIDGKRVQVTDIAITTKEAIENGTAPISNFCFAEDTNEMYRYDPVEEVYKSFYTVEISDSSTAEAIGTSEALVTERDIYNGLPKINNTKQYDANTEIFAPTVSGSKNQMLVAVGERKTPQWRSAPTVNSKLGFGYGVCTTDIASEIKVVEITDYELIKGGLISIRFENIVPEGSLLNINGKGALPMRINGAAISDDVIEAGDNVLFVYDGLSYEILTVSSVTNNMTKDYNYDFGDEDNEDITVDAEEYDFGDEDSIIE